MPRPSAHKSNLKSKTDFLLRLRHGHTVTEAVKGTGVSRRTFYDWRDQDAEFRELWDDAIKESVEELEKEVRRRALDPDDKQSYILLMFLLKKHDPTYRENYKREVNVTHTKVQEIDFSRAEMDQALDILTRERDKTKPESDASA